MTWAYRLDILEMSAKRQDAGDRYLGVAAHLTARGPCGDDFTGFSQQSPANSLRLRPPPATARIESRWSAGKGGMCRYLYHDRRSSNVLTPASAAPSVAGRD